MRPKTQTAALKQAPPYIRRRDLYPYLGISRATLDSWVKGDRVFANGRTFPKGVRVGGVRIFATADIMAFLASFEDRA